MCVSGGGGGGGGVRRGKRDVCWCCFNPVVLAFFFDFSTITECSDVDETQWDFAFQLCAKHKNNVELLKMLTKALNDVGLPVPDDLASLLSQGLLCTCQQRKATPGKGRVQARRQK